MGAIADRYLVPAPPKFCIIFCFGGIADLIHRRSTAEEDFLETTFLAQLIPLPWQ